MRPGPSDDLISSSLTTAWHCPSSPDSSRRFDGLYTPEDRLPTPNPLAHLDGCGVSIQRTGCRIPPTARKATDSHHPIQYCIPVIPPPCAKPPTY